MEFSYHDLNAFSDVFVPCDETQDECEFFFFFNFVKLIFLTLTPPCYAQPSPDVLAWKEKGNKAQKIPA